ncbi:chromosome transmission fidelity protein 18 homolog isoform X2 [Phymastichus coffea]|uniref:chromosome transmission fidelity protein 18 homolog isoform X2 n=1 Tax=Phymastichus coffea TaxID=108790 RepID=UPI00273C0869|nr:chromosome transmission fidelity protein 18 homolog isoform X2 [Phymastichus coffea]
MDNEFPDPEDEFDLEHEDEYEVLRELEAAERGEVISNKSIVESQITKQISQNINSNSQLTNKFSNSQNTQSNDLTLIETVQNQLQLSIDTSRKRPIDQISQETLFNINDSIDVSDFNGFDQVNLQQNKRPCWDQPDEVIRLILDRRKLLQSGFTNNSIVGNIEKSTYDRTKKNSITTRVPKYDFIALTRTEDGNRIYIKVSEKNKYVPKAYKSSSGFLIKSFNHLKGEAENIVSKINKRDDLFLESSNQENLSCELWVDKYRPKRYLELLSDEHVNKSLLYWLKLWDKIVFDRDPKVRSKKPQAFSKFKSKFKKKENVPDHDSKGFPTQRIALLTGSPGLGKTTLAHIAAKHAGYNIVELNASDDRGPEAFREALLASTQMRAVIDQEKRPNCLVLDEIDGAPAASIDLLLKFIHGKLAPKGKNAKKNQKENNGCRRPIICICNDLYTPSLRPLRSMALILNVPEISPAMLADRLKKIACKEGLQVDSKVLLDLAQRSACDVRACLGILQYTGGKPDMLKNLAFGLKDMRKGLFESWKELLQVPMTREGIVSEHKRAQKVVKIVHQGEPERLMQGIFHNYPEICKDRIVLVSESLEWFEFYDQVNALVMERQTWMLMPYTMSAFVAWHLYLSGTQVPKISFPSAALEVNQKLERNMAILTITKKVSKYDILTLIAEILPYLPDLLTPKLRSVNAQLYSQAEKQNLDRLVNLMLDFGLTFTQEKKPEGGYEYILDPNVWDIGTFPEGKARKQLPYAVKQIVIQELEAARIRRSVIMSGEEETKKLSTWPSSSSKENPGQSKSKADGSLPNHLKQQLNPIEITPRNDKRCRNFFSAFQKAGQENLKTKKAKDIEMGIISPETLSKAERDRAFVKAKMDLMKSDVHYVYNEGYTNAVRRKVFMKDLI